MQSLKVTLFNVEVDALTMKQTVALIDEAIQSKRQIVHNCINANKVVLMEKDIFLQKSLQEADIISADGQAIIWASKILGVSLPERVPGIDLFKNLMDLANAKGYKSFLFGAKEQVVKDVAAHYNQIFDKEIVSGFRNGYFNESEEGSIIQQINDSGAQMLFVAIPSPQKETFINKYRHRLSNVKLLMGVGGSFDVVSGIVIRAPLWMQKNGLEWLFRLVQEPQKMWKRYLIGNIEFLFLLFKNKFKIGT